VGLDKLMNSILFRTIFIISEGFKDQDYRNGIIPHKGGDFHGFAGLAPKLEIMRIHWRIFKQDHYRLRQDVRSPQQDISMYNGADMPTPSTLGQVMLILDDRTLVHEENEETGNGFRIANHQLKTLVRLVQFPTLKTFSLSFASGAMLDVGDRESCLSSVVEACTECHAGLENTSVGLGFENDNKDARDRQ
jgi:hypothetical protein